MIFVHATWIGDTCKGILKMQERFYYCEKLGFKLPLTTTIKNMFTSKLQMIFSILIKLVSIIVINRLALPNINLIFLSSLYHIYSHMLKVQEKYLGL